MIIIVDQAKVDRFKHVCSVYRLTGCKYEEECGKLADQWRRQEFTLGGPTPGGPWGMRHYIL